MPRDGLTFAGYLPPASVPPDPIDEDWRGPPGPPGPSTDLHSPGPIGDVTASTAAFTALVTAALTATTGAVALGSNANPVRCGSGSNNILTITPGATTSNGVRLQTTAGSYGVSNVIVVGGTTQNAIGINPGTNTTAAALIKPVNNGGLIVSPAPNTSLVFGDPVDGVGSAMTISHSAGGGVTVLNTLTAKLLRTTVAGYVLSGAAVPVLQTNSSWSGTYGSGAPTAFNSIAISSDNVAGGVLSALQIDHNIGGAAMSGGRNSLLVQTNVNGVTAANSGASSASFWATIGSGAGANSIWYATNPQIIAQAGANIYGIFGSEVNIKAFTGSALNYKSVYQFINLQGDAVQGAVYDAAIGFASQVDTASNPTIGWRNILAIGRQDGQWPVDAALGTILGTYRQTANSISATPPFKPMRAQYGIHWADVFFGTASLELPGFRVGGDATTFIGGMVITPTDTTVSIDAIRKRVSAYSVNTGGTGFKVGEDVYDANGNSWEITSVSGTIISGVLIKNRGYITGAGPATVAVVNGHGTGAVLNTTWTTADALSLQPSGGKLGVFGATPVVKQTAVPVTAAGVHAALVAYGLIS